MISSSSLEDKDLWIDVTEDWPTWGILAMDKQADCGGMGCVWYALARALSTDKRP